MQSLPLPLTRELVLVGGGHTHALVLRSWGMRPLPGARLTVINPEPTAPYSGMLPGYVAGHYRRDDLDIDLVKLTRFAGARLILGRVDGIDIADRTVHVAGRGSIAYDIASVDIGITSDLPDLPGFAEHAVAAKPLGVFADAWEAHMAAGALGDIALIGGGVAGIELAMAMARATRTLPEAGAITVIEAGPTPARGMSDSNRARLMAAASGLGVTVITNRSAQAVTADGVMLGNGDKVAARFVVGVAGARPQDWLAETGLDLTDGFITVDHHLRSVTDPSVYAVGDCAHLAHDPRPKAGVFAVRAAPTLTHNLRGDLSGGKRKSFKPQSDYLKLVSLGGQAALADKWGMGIAGEWVWRWKDRIDRRFMHRLNNLPTMPKPALPREVATDVRAAMHGGQALCGGCGAKVGPASLARALRQMPDITHPDVLTGPGDDAAILRVGGARQVLTTDHLRAFIDDPGVMARIAAMHALGDIWAMGARPQAVLASIILPPMSERLSEVWLEEIMQAAGDAFAAEGAPIAGGHTTQGAELTLGFSIAGLLDGEAVTLKGAQPGDALVLTRPIGSGVLLAGEMAGRARGVDVAAAWSEMSRSQGASAAILRQAHAMTDVTGFGLAGHLLAMLDASAVGARIALADVPVYQGALALSEAGQRSTLFEQNRVAAIGRVKLAHPGAPKAELLFDPQTSGGLLAAVAGAEADLLVEDLKGNGAQAARIGEIVAGDPILTVV